jgi:hypothetical protein
MRNPGSDRQAKLGTSELNVGQHLVRGLAEIWRKVGKHHRFWRQRELRHLRRCTPIDVRAVGRACGPTWVCSPHLLAIAGLYIDRPAHAYQSIRFIGFAMIAWAG